MNHKSVCRTVPAWSVNYFYTNPHHQERQSLVPESPLLVAFVVFVALITFNAGQMLLAGGHFSSNHNTIPKGIGEVW